MASIENPVIETELCFKRYKSYSVFVDQFAACFKVAKYPIFVTLNSTLNY